MTKRELFEAWAESQKIELHKVTPCDGSSPYYGMGNGEWAAWQAGRAPQPSEAQEPQLLCHKCGVDRLKTRFPCPYETCGIQGTTQPIEDDADALTIAYSSGFERGKDAGRADRLEQPINLAGVVMRFADRDVKLTVLEREYVDDRYCLIVAPQQAQEQEPVEGYLADEGVEHSHPKYGRGVFFTYNCAKGIYLEPQPAQSTDGSEK